MTRRGSRTEGRQPTGDRPAGDRVTRGIYPDAPVLTCGTCLAIYRDFAESRQAHKTVFGHWPTQPRKPAPATDETRPGEAEARASGDASSTHATAESAPEQHQEGAGWTL